jgi:tetratricopeptide (TPR) repeat protein
MGRVAGFRQMSAALVCATLMFSPAFAAGQKSDACLKSSYFNQPNETIEICSALLEKPVGKKQLKAQYSYRVGMAYHFLSNPTAALLYFEKALADDPELVDALTQSGWAYYNLGDLGRSRNFFTEALAKDDKNVRAILGLGFLYSYAGQDEAYMQALDQALEIDPNYHLARANRAWMYHKFRHDSELALREFAALRAMGREALKDVEFNSKVRLLTGYDFYASLLSDSAEVLEGLHRYSEILPFHNELIEMYPRSAYFVSYRAKLYNILGKYDLALADANKAIALDPNLFIGHLAKIQVFYQLGRFDEAKQVIATLETLNIPPRQQTEAFLYRGLIYRAEDKIDLAKADLVEVYRRDPRLMRTMIERMIAAKYYAGNVSDGFSEAFMNGLEACLIDKECIQ